MFFTLRCVFWLGIVFVAIHHRTPEADARFFASQASQPATTSATASQAFETICLRLPRLCARMAKGAGGALSTTIRVAAADSASAQSLRGADFQAPWRGPARQRR